MLLSKDEIIKKVKAILSNIKGVRGVYELNKEELQRILEIEYEYEKRSGLMFMRCYNAGIRCVSKRDVILAILHDENYCYPPEVVELLYEGEVVGEEIRDKRRIDELKGRKDVILLGETFVIYKDRLPEKYRSKLTSGSLYIFIPPMSVKELENVKEIYGVVEAMPSTEADRYLKEILRERKADVSHSKLGVALIGFNILLCTP
jgi:hypothetical protein